MAELQKKGDYFGTFLDALESQEQRPTGHSDALVKILTLLAKAGPRPVLELAQKSELSLTEFSAELDAARAAGFVEVTGAPPDEKASLTAAGKELSSRLEAA